MNTFTNLEEYKKFLNKQGISLDDIMFPRKSTAVVTKIGVSNNEEYSGNIYEKPLTAPDFSAAQEIARKIDFNMPYRINTDNYGRIRDFSYYEKESRELIVLYGAEASTAFYVFVGALENYKKEHANVTSIDEMISRR